MVASTWTSPSLPRWGALCSRSWALLWSRSRSSSRLNEVRNFLMGLHSRQTTSTTPRVFITLNNLLHHRLQQESDRFKRILEEGSQVTIFLETLHQHSQHHHYQRVLWLRGLHGYIRLFDGKSRPTTRIIQERKDRPLHEQEPE